MDKIVSPFVSQSPNNSEVIDANQLNNDSMIYSANASSHTLRDAKGVKVEADLQLL